MEKYHISWEGLKMEKIPTSPSQTPSLKVVATVRALASCGACRSILLCKGLSFLFSAFLFFCGEITQGFPASSEHVEPSSCRVLFTRRAHDLVFCENLPYKTTQTICNNLLSFPLACSTWRKNNHNRKK